MNDTVFSRPQDRRLEDLTEEELKICMKDQLWRLNNLYKIITKDKKIETFRMNWAQEALYQNMWYMNIILKARQLGFTTFILIYALDCCLFNDHFRAGIVAHNREDASAFFRDKLKFAYDHLPVALKAERPTVAASKSELVFSNGSSVRVGTSMRGGTFNLLHVSEFGKVCRKFPDKAEEIVTGSFQTIQAGQLIFVESTAEGRQGYFFDYCQTSEQAKLAGRKLTALDFRFNFYSWHDHPEYELDPDGVVFTIEQLKYFKKMEVDLGKEINVKKRAWWVKKWQLLGDKIYQEYPSTPAEAFKAAIEGAYYAEQFKKIYAEKRITKVPVVPGVAVDTWWDLGFSDSMCIWFTQDVGRELHIVDYYENSGEGFPHYAQVLKDKNYFYGRHVAPHDIAQHEIGTGKSRIETARALGINFDTCPMISIEDGIEAVRNLLPICYFDEEKTDKGVTALENYRKEWDEKLGTYKKRPLHDWASHGSDAFRTLAVAHHFGHRTAHAARPVQTRSAGGWT